MSAAAAATTIDEQHLNELRGQAVGEMVSGRGAVKRGGVVARRRDAAVSRAELMCALMRRSV